ncbi:hypothetical protein [Salinisphaera sp. S4-8]|uniref:hypothetical protein n=1 Tax=Salinisphaera sp. S4-8 TaxID=633357 RepID=UPI0033401FF6
MRIEDEEVHDRGVLGRGTGDDVIGGRGERGIDQIQAEQFDRLERGITQRGRLGEAGQGVETVIGKALVHGGSPAVCLGVDDP